MALNVARVGTLAQSNIALNAINRAQRNLIEQQNQLSTGKRLNTPSDDAGDAAAAQHLRKLLEQRDAYKTNLGKAQSQLSEVDSTLNDMTTLLQEAQDIASANVGSDVSADARAAAGTVVQSLYNQILSLANKQFQETYLFGGAKQDGPPFVEANGGVRFEGSLNLLHNQMDENALLRFMADGNEIFGAMAGMVQGSADLSPTISAATRLGDMRGATGDGVRLGSIRVSDGTTSAVVDLSAASTIGDVITAINNAGVGSITASIAAGGAGIQLTGGATENIAVAEVGGGKTAQDLGIFQPAGAGVGAPLVGGGVQPRVTNLTPLSALRGGTGIDQAGGLTIQVGTQSKVIDLSSASTVEDMLNAINGAGIGVRASINAAGNGIDILNVTSAVEVRIGESTGTTAADLGVRSFVPATALSALNNGRGVTTVDGDDLQITRTDGSTFAVDLSGARTVQDVIDAINAADGGAGVTASFGAGVNGIILTDTAGGAGVLAIAPLNHSQAMADLGLDVATVGNTITGRDVNPVTPDGLFTNLRNLHAALQANDQKAITRAAEGLQKDYDRLVRVRGQNGAQIQELESRTERLEDQNLATRAVLAELEEVDITEAIIRFQTLQTALQATLKSSGTMLNMSLLDFI